MKLQVQR